MIHYTTKACVVEFNSVNVGKVHGKITLPAGLRCTKIEGSSSPGHANSFFLDEFPSNIFPERSMIRHDAESYGLVLSADQVEATP